MLALAFALACNAALATAHDTRPADAPRLVLSEMAYDAGTIDRGTTLVHRFPVRNAGTKPLTLDVKPSCGCTTVDMSKIVAPGETGHVTLSIDTKRFKGPIRKTAVVTTNDPAATSVEIALASTVIAPIDCQPSESVLLTGAAEPKHVLTLRASDGPLVLDRLDAEGSFFRHSIADLPDGVQELSVWLAPDAPKGLSRGRITLVAAKPSGATMEIPVTARVD